MLLCAGDVGEEGKKTEDRMTIKETHIRVKRSAQQCTQSAVCRQKHGHSASASPKLRRDQSFNTTTVVRDSLHHLKTYVIYTMLKGFSINGVDHLQKVDTENEAKVQTVHDLGF